MPPCRGRISRLFGFLEPRECPRPFSEGRAPGHYCPLISRIHGYVNIRGLPWWPIRPLWHEDTGNENAATIGAIRYSVKIRNNERKLS